MKLRFKALEQTDDLLKKDESSKFDQVLHCLGGMKRDSSGCDGLCEPQNKEWLMDCLSDAFPLDLRLAI